MPMMMSTNREVGDGLMETVATGRASSTTTRRTKTELRRRVAAVARAGGRGGGCGSAVPHRRRRRMASALLGKNSYRGMWNTEQYQNVRHRVLM